jgi:hypothetical protein
MGEQMSEAQANRIVVASEEQVSGKLTGERVVLSMKDGTYYGLSDVGALVWDLVQEPISTGDLVDRILDSYKVDRAVCERDVLELLREMAARSLVVFQECATASRN